MSREQEVRGQALERVRGVRRALDTEVLRHLDRGRASRIRPRLPRIFIGALVALVLVLPAPAAGTGFVERFGTGLVLDGHPYRFTGLNIYNANSNGLCWYSMSGSVLDESLAAIGPGKGVFRAWFFQQLATTGGARDWSAFDRTLAAARARGFKVIATLIDQWGNCGSLDTTGAYKDESWYTQGYKDPDPMGIVSYRDWVAEVVARYRDDPTILAWQLVNEAEVKPSLNEDCSEGGAAILKAFATDVSGLIKSIDPNHLVSLGTLGGGQCATQFTEYKDVHSVSTIDLCEYHDYDPNAVLPGDPWNGLAFRINQCHELGKPIFVGEAGIVPNALDGTLESRADTFAGKFEAQFSAGVVGELVWAWNKDGSSLETFDVGPDDPVLPVLEAYGFHYDFAGFASPVDNPPVVNRARAGSAIPVKFSLGGNRGLDVFAFGFPRSDPISCETNASLDVVEETVSPGRSALTYDAASDLYTYVWRTERSWSGCRELTLRFGDGYEHTAIFKLAK